MNGDRIELKEPWVVEDVLDAMAWRPKTIVVHASTASLNLIRDASNCALDMNYSVRVGKDLVVMISRD